MDRGQLCTSCKGCGDGEVIWKHKSETMSHINRSKQARELWKWSAEGLGSASDLSRKLTVTSLSHFDTEWEDVALTRVHVQERKERYSLRKTVHFPSR